MDISHITLDLICVLVGFKWKDFNKLHLSRVWNFGSVYCCVNQFISLSTVSASVFTMLAITLERRRAVMKPLRAKTTRAVVIISLLLIWSLCSLIALPPTLYSNTVTAPRNKTWVENRGISVSLCLPGSASSSGLMGTRVILKLISSKSRANLEHGRINLLLLLSKVNDNNCLQTV